MDTREINFENHIEQYLINKGGYTIGDESEYDSCKGYKPSTLIEFVKSSQEIPWDRFVKVHGLDSESYFLKKVEDKIKEFGLLKTLRDGIKLNGISFKLIYFKPETKLNDKSSILYDSNICECVRQLHYSQSNRNSLDMVLFVNGFPLVTLELKNQYTGQNVNHAIKQYKFDRKSTEPIFKFNNRSLVHFAVDLFECMMTTKLNEAKTFFLPFNQGSNGSGNVGGAGNPNIEGEFSTSYLWENVLRKDKLFDIVQKYIHLDYEKGKSYKLGKLIFPRYHQLDVVTKLVKSSVVNGAGKNYLIQHSAGSGKSNSIAWLSYRLSSLHNRNNKKIYDSVIVITDRKVLDNQLQDTIYQFDHVDGVVEKIDDKKSSKDLRDAINSGKKIIITTLQKFPVVYKDLDSSGKKYAVIIDEAHSSQTGQAASKLKEGLGNTEDILKEYADIELKNEMNTLSAEDKMLAELAAHGIQKNISFYAFTATPKEKTLQLFGEKQQDGSYVPFHVYSMQQAIEEGFILDVLQNYMTYKTFYKIAKTASEDPEIKASKGVKAIARYQSLHPYNISQKTAVMIEHFRNTTCKKLNGKAKAMVVTSSRLHAVRYVNEFKKYIKDNNITDTKVLVAFSGEVLDGGVTYTETGINIDEFGSRISEKSLPNEFKNNFNVLIVAEKYQTGFDEPLLHTMFVDKPLSGVKAVQTLSRLNRTTYGKSDTFILDFVNEAQDIQNAFQPYYNCTRLTEGIDPNDIYSIFERVDAYNVINNNDIRLFTELYYNDEENMEQLNYYLHPSIKKYNELDKDDKKEFKSIVQAFLRAYAFIVQVERMMDEDMQANYVYCKYLNSVLPKNFEDFANIDGEIELEYYRLEKQFEGSIELKEEEGRLDPASGNIGMLVEEEEEPLSVLIERINDKYGAEFTNVDKVMDIIKQDFIDNDSLVELAKNNNDNDMKKVYDEEFTKVVITRLHQNEKLFERMINDEEYMEALKNVMFKEIIGSMRSRA